MPSIIAMVNRDLGAAVRRSTVTGSPYFAHGHLARELSWLLDRVDQLAAARPDLFDKLAAHLQVAATVQTVQHELTNRAGGLLDRALEHRPARAP